MSQVTLNVEGMSCGHCVSSIEKALREVGAEGHVDLDAKKVSISYDEEKVTLDQLKEAIEDQGYDVVS
jgi:copper chaperone